MTIFFTGSITGGRAHQPQYESIVALLKQFGSLASEHVADSTLSHYGETSLSSREIFERELRLLEQSDVIVAEVTEPSLGVGYFIAHATSKHKKVIALYFGEDTLKLSAIIKGGVGVAIYTYLNENDLKNILASVLAET